ncbi:FUSC family protein [Xanthobacter sediminis]
MWISFGALRASLSDTGSDYRARLPVVIIGPMFGVVGFLAGFLSDVPWSVTVAIMSIAGFLAAVASSYSSLLSTGVTQALLIAGISIGLPKAATGWQPVFLYVAGIALYAGMLGIEALCSRGRARNDAALAMIGALGELAARRAAAPSGGGIEQPEIESARRTVTACLTTLGAAAMRAASQYFGRSDEASRLAAILGQGDAVFVAIMASRNTAALKAAAATLRATAAGEAVPLVGHQGALGTALDALLSAPGSTDAAPSAASRMPMASHGAPVSRRIHVAIDRLIPTGAVARSATATALCLGIAYATRWLISAEHWYWIPLTVGLVMKPDLGSVFARAVLRVAGTVIGAAIGAAIIFLVPKGVWLAAPIALFAGLTPVAAQRSYALLAAAVTPIILILVSILDPGPIDAVYGIHRVVDTSIGGGIALVFGYFIWPKTHFNELSADFYRAKQGIANYIRSAAARDGGSAESRLPVIRRETYRGLMDMRTHLRTALAEPPPASDEAAAWFPLIAAAERICDHVTAYTTEAGMPVPPVEAEALDRLAARIATTPEERRHRPVPSCTGCSAPVVELFGEIERELQHMDRLRDDYAFLAVSRAARRRHSDDG